MSVWVYDAVSFSVISQQARVTGYKVSFYTWRMDEDYKFYWIQYTRGPFYYHGLTLIPAWISNPIFSKLWDEITYSFASFTLRWRHNEHDGVSNHQPHDCLLNRLFRRRSKKISKLHVTGHCAGNSPGTGEFPAQMTSNAENVSIWWRHREQCNRWSLEMDKLFHP